LRVDSLERGKKRKHFRKEKKVKKQGQEKQLKSKEKKDRLG
jgi:hypothetical protein